MSKKRIFVTGAAGFIGYHLCRYLHSRGDFVIGLDNFNDYYDPLIKHDRAAELGKLNIQVKEGDILDTYLLEKFVAERSC